MKKLLGSLLVFTLILTIFLFSGSASAFALGSVWEKEYRQDVFGDPTDEWYITNKKHLSGTFNSSTAEGAPLGADIRIGLDGASIILFENGTDKIKNSSEKDYEYTIAIKMADGKKASTSGTMDSGTDEIEVWDMVTLAEALYGRGKASIYLEREDQKITNYLFHVECDNFETLFKEELYLAAKQYRQNGDYIPAADIFIFLGEYKDSKALGAEAMNARRYADAEKALRAGKYNDAIAAFEKLGDYEDSQARADEARDALYGPDYAKAEALFSSEKHEEAIQIYEKLNSYRDSAGRIEEAREAIRARDYAAAEALYEAGQYEQAIAAFEALGDYGDSAGRIEEAREAIPIRDYAAAEALYEAGQYEQAITAFTALGDYKDSAGRIEEVIRARDYAAAEALLEAGQYEQAYAEFVKLKGYQDVDSLLEKDEHLIAAAAARKAAFTTIGNTVSFGTYEQDNNTANGKEEIEWVVLATEGNRSLLISKYALDCQQYNTKYTDVTWETCSLRKWLNETFLNAAFSKEEQAMIPAMTVSADKNPSYSTSPGKSTEDQVFLLSIPEAKRYFSSDEARKCAPTAYAIARGAWTSNNYSVGGKATCWWWLRSPGNYSFSAACVDNGGSVQSIGDGVNDDDIAVRPALWIFPRRICVRQGSARREYFVYCQGR